MRLRPIAVLSVVLACGCGRGSAHAPPPEEVTPARLAAGREIFELRCVSCHGTAGEGTRLGPDLTDGEWLHLSGSVDEITRLVARGVPSPVRYPTAMPPGGGGVLDEDRLRAVAAYAWSLSHPAALPLEDR